MAGILGFVTDTHMSDRTKRISGLRFGLFELDLRNRELRQAGVLVKLPAQSFNILA
jgi:hypothetical protein